MMIMKNNRKFASRKYFLSPIVIYLVILNFALSKSVPVKNICSTADCNKIAREISLKININTSPCDDFYEFVCGNYIKNSLPTKTHLNLYEEMQTNSNAMLITLLENNHRKEINKPFRHLSTLYKLCMDQNTLIKQGAKPLRDILNQFGGWPLLHGDQWNEIGSNWMKINSDLIKFGFSFDLFLKFSIINNTRVTPNYRVVSLDRPVIKYNLNRNSLDSVYNFNDDSVKNALKLGATRENAEKDLLKSRRLLIELINIVTNTETKTRVMTLDELSIKWPSVNWTIFFTDILSISSALPISRNDIITVDELYIDEIVKLMNNTSSRILMNYALARVVEESLIYIRLENITHLSSSRSELCIRIIGTHLPNILDAMYALNYIDDAKRNETINMMAAIKDQFRKIIEQTNWLDSQTKNKVIGKLLSISGAIGYLDEWKTDEWMALYNNLEVDGKNFLRCILDITRFKKSFEYEAGHKHIENEKRLIQMNRMPHYRSFENKIIISAAFIQHILLNNKLPKYINYGRMGFFIGHEIIHSFDGIEELLKINKNLMESSKNKFLGETACIINQYSNYNVEEINTKLNGNSSVHEDIADNSGVKLAYSAYTHWVEQNGHDSTLPNLNYTPAQMFWINMANPWCTKIHPDTLRDLINEKYSPANFRIIGAVSNNDDFSRDFNCAKGSKMNPTKKCTVW